MIRRTLSALAATLLLGALTSAHAQTTGGAKGFLYRAAAAVLGQPLTPKGAKAAEVHSATGDIPGTMGAGQAVTDGPVYRPISPAHGQFAGIFDTYSIAEGARRGHYPRVALTFETYGATVPCWKVRATIWQSAKDHHDERFELCDAPLTTTDDLGNPAVIADPTLDLTSVIESTHTSDNMDVSVIDERTTGPNPPRTPFALNVSSSTPNASTFAFQYKAIMARAMVISGYASRRDVSGPESMRTATLAGSAGQLMWLAGFAPGGNQDH